ncbi:bifunctional enoyl-CoA hydratase/phosphate acetyltransferase [Thalassolituus sp.]|uniref:bifunctional enoyl-CoA hydratase/phosphate acetyltransferase n=1 Tax=Thalassolituus sp. TaxID=2030822 RepID=UPI002A81C69B|nr:bifunctional enoyl-CoA hydratase/phosphate acetyltransferase [Thalassolituus sp.]
MEALAAGRLKEELDAALTQHPRMQLLLERALRSEAVKTAIVHPVTFNSLSGALAAHNLGLIEAILVGPKERITQCAAENNLDISALVIHDSEHSHHSAEVAVSLVRQGAVNALMKGGLSTDELLGAVLDKVNGIRTERRISHVFYLDIPLYHKALLVTDAAINIQPSLRDKKDIVANAIDLAHHIGIACPKVAILSAVEKVNPDIPSTIEAAALCKMADRKQIMGGLLDGPLAFDNAINREAALEKGIESEVAGDADILLAPDLEAGNILAKQLMYLGNALAAGVLVGARVPIILTSRAEKTAGRILSCALAQAAAQPLTISI